tara:strand:+ start:28 stop:411 length:384 start_codon:yes stop_codon:yes gene_type:complete
MNTTQKQKMYQRIEKHGEDLKTIFKLSTDVDSIKLCKQLFRLENKAHRLAEDDYNGLNVEKEVEKVFKSISKILNLKNLNDFKIFFNNDPRGYALKIDDEFVRENKLEIHRDWGGNGILAPDFSDHE